MQKLIFTGNGSAGIALTAAITAVAAAQKGQRTLIASVGPSHSLSTLFQTSLSDTPQTLAPNLDAWEHNPFTTMEAQLEKLRPNLVGSIAQISGDELPTLPGLDLFLALNYIQRHAADTYDLVVIDAGPHDLLLRALSIPDGFRWLLRLIFGLDRDPGRNPESVNQALLPSNLLTFSSINAVQGVRVELEQLRDRAVDTLHTTARYVLRPDAPALEDARLAIAALQLHGLAIDSLVVGPLLPDHVSDTSLSTIAAQQQDIVAAAQQTWQERTLFRLLMEQENQGIESLAKAGKALYQEHEPNETFGVVRPVEYGNGDDPFIAMQLPGLPREAMNLTLGYDELVVQIRHYRRHLLLPKSLRGTTSIRASREQDRVTVRLRH